MMITLITIIIIIVITTINTTAIDVESRKLKRSIAEEEKEKEKAMSEMMAERKKCELKEREIKRLSVEVREFSDRWMDRQKRARERERERLLFVW